MELHHTPAIIIGLEKLHLSLSHLALLQYLQATDFTNADQFPEVIKNTLCRKGYIEKFDNGYIITEEGKKLYNTLLDPDYTTEIIIKKKRLDKTQQDHRFLLWLSHYPATASFSINGRDFINSRVIRQNTAEIEQKFLAVLNSGEHTYEEMIKVLDFQVELVKKDSLKSGDNKMIYFQGPLPYLNQSTYNKYFDTMKQLNWQPKSDLASSKGVTTETFAL